jgi:hypothetical protein
VTDKLTIEVSRDGWTKGFQLSISKLDETGVGDGYRLAGPKFNGSGKVLLSRTLDERDAEEIRRYLDAMFPVAAGRWTELRDEIQDLRTSCYDTATALEDEGKPSERAFGRVDALDDVLLRMARMGDGS